MKIITTILLTFNLYANTMIHVASKNVLSRDQFISEISIADIIVIGEKHYTQKIQDQEGMIIKDVLEFRNRFTETNFTLGWEFLNNSDNFKIQSLISDLKNNLITTEDFLLSTQNNKDAHVYAPIINETLRFDGQIIGVNLSRLEKAPVVKNGIGALDPKLLPPNFKEGGSAYFDRFYEVMKSHATDEQIKNYFTAQSLVDDVSAFSLLKNQADLKFLVIGAFHSMYNDGVVARLKARAGHAKVINIEVIDEADYPENETDLDLLLNDPKYGYRADYIIFLK